MTVLAAAHVVDLSGFLAGFAVGLAVLLGTYVFAAGLMIFRKVTGL